MALPPVLSEDALARFRTKHCERLLVAGKCSFDGKCQYSHETTCLRRNPKKHTYAPRLCRSFKNGTCDKGMECGFSHSRDEVLYHPLAYKRTMCSGESSCEGYYCPFAHGPGELRKLSSMGDEKIHVIESINDLRGTAMAVQHRRRGARQCRQHHRGAHLTASIPPPPGLGSEENEVDRHIASLQDSQLSYVKIDEYLQVAFLPPSVPLPQDSKLPGGFGRFVPGKLQSKRTASDRPVKCFVRLIPAGRKDCLEAARVSKDLKRWMSSATCEGAREALDMRRTVATIAIAVSPNCSFLDQNVQPGMGGLINAERPLDVRLTSQFASWISQLLSEVSNLHAEGLHHWCITPHSIAVRLNGTLCLGDFLGKIRVMHLLGNGWEDGASSEEEDTSASSHVGNECSPDWQWAMWFPAEVQSGISAASAKRSDMSRPRNSSADSSSPISPHFSYGLDASAVDMWQLGVTVFYMLTGEHLFGDMETPHAVCQNILDGRPVNLRLLGSAPVFKNFCQVLTAKQAEDRPISKKLCKHPLLWTLADAAKFLGESTNVHLSHVAQLPCFALYGGSQCDTMAQSTLAGLLKYSDLASEDDSPTCDINAVISEALISSLDKQTSALDKPDVSPVRGAGREKRALSPFSQLVSTPSALSSSASPILSTSPACSSTGAWFGAEVDLSGHADFADPWLGFWPYAADAYPLEYFAGTPSSMEQLAAYPNPFTTMNFECNQPVLQPLNLAALLEAESLEPMKVALPSLASLPESSGLLCDEPMNIHSPENIAAMQHLLETSSSMFSHVMTPQYSESEISSSIPHEAAPSPSYDESFFSHTDIESCLNSLSAGMHYHCL